MKPRSAVLLSILGLVVLGLAWYLSRPQLEAPPGPPPSALAFPGLADKLDRAARVEISSAGKTLTLQRQGEIWGIAERNNYPVQAGRLRALLTGLAELRLTDPRTAEPGEYAEIGVEDPSGKDATSTLLRVLDAQGAPLAQIILGHRRLRTSGNLPEAIDVRKPDDKQSWLAEGRVAAEPDPQAWFDRDILDIPRRDIAHIDMQRGADRLVFAHHDGKLTLVEPADHPALDPAKVEDVGRALESLTFSDVRPAKGALEGIAPLGEAVFTTDPGLRIAVTLRLEGADLWARFAVTGEGAAKEDAHRLAAKLDGWDYKIGAWKEKSLLPELADLEAPPPEKPKP